MTTKTLKALSEMWNRGIPPKEMAHAFGINEWTLWTYIRRHRDLFPNRRHHAEWWRSTLAGVDGLNGDQAAARLGVSSTTVYKWRKRWGM